ncbi:MAG: translation elongation factor Ts [Chlamydiota bacterium]
MALVTADMVKELRTRTGVGMGKCKEALDGAAGDMELAIANLRKAGIASAVKKEGRETKEGLIAAFDGKRCVALVEVNAETDFVTKNETFRKFAEEIAAEIANTNPASLETFLAQPYSKDASVSIDQQRAIVMQTVGENMKIQRLLVWSKGEELSLAAYTHMGGRIVTLVEIQGASDQEALAKDIAMHIAAEAPLYLQPEDVPASVKASEEDIASAQVKDKPAEMLAKIVAGKLNAFYDQTCLLRQKFIKDSSLTIAKLVENKSKEIGKPLTVTRFVRWQVGAA